jgi:prepilin-type N-terminal cleavage/methylation domain-containing protein
MAPSRPARGFTLIEMLAVVVILGVLATIATVAYRRYVRASHVEEAQDMVINIRAAEEAFYGENNGYLDVSGCLGTNCTYPSRSPGAFKTSWGGPCGWCKNPASGWDGLAVSANGPVYYGYAVIADAATPPAGRGVGSAQVYHGRPLDVTNLGAGGNPWYFVEADGNLTGDNVHFTHVYGVSGMTQIFVDGADQ